MKRTILIAMMLMIMVSSLVGCGYQTVPPQWEGVKVTVMGDDRGKLETVGVGRNVYPAWKYTFHLFPLYKQNIVWTANKQEGSPNDDSISFPNSESLNFKANVGLSFSVKPGASTRLFKEYNKGMEEIINIDMRNSVRNAFVKLGSRRDTEEVFGSGLADFIDLVNEEVREQWSDTIDVHEVYVIGSLEPPSSVITSINNKIEASQLADQRQREIITAMAQRKIDQERADAEAYNILAKAQAEASSIELIQKQLSRSPEYVAYLKAMRWDGKLPKITGGSNVIPMVNIE